MIEKQESLSWDDGTPQGMLVKVGDTGIYVGYEIDLITEKIVEGTVVGIHLASNFGWLSVRQADGTETKVCQ